MSLLIKSQLEAEMMASPQNLSGLEPGLETLSKGLPRKVDSFLTTSLRSIVAEFGRNHE
jgi:hypothetical protein